MSSLAIGLIETIGLVPAIEAADASLKAALVELLAYRYVTGGLVTIILTGDVGAVKAAVEAGVAAASKVGKVVSSHVIPRLDEQVLGIIDGLVKDKFKMANKKIPFEPEGLRNLPCLESDLIEELSRLREDVVSLLRKAGKADLVKDNIPLHEHGVNKLRVILRTIGGDVIDKTEMYRLRKPELLKLLVDVIRRKIGGESEG